MHQPRPRLRRQGLRGGREHGLHGERVRSRQGLLQRRLSGARRRGLVGLRRLFGDGLRGDWRQNANMHQPRPRLRRQGLRGGHEHDVFWVVLPVGTTMLWHWRKRELC